MDSSARESRSDARDTAYSFRGKPRDTPCCFLLEQVEQVSGLYQKPDMIMKVLLGQITGGDI